MSNFSFDLESKNDEDFFSSLQSKSTKLEQLFGGGIVSHEEGQQTLKYHRPKISDVPTTARAEAVAVTWSTHLAKVASAFKQGEPVGKVGVALLSNTNGSCKIIVYKTKTHVLGTLTLGQGQDQLYKQNRYLQFYDEAGIYWSLYFEKVADEEEFYRNVKDLGFEANERVEEMKIDIRKERTREKVDSGTDDDITNTNNRGEAVTSNPESQKKYSKKVLISRMAKMGQQLPKLSNNYHTTTECSDSSDTEVISTPMASSQKPLIVPRNSKLQTNKLANQIVAASSNSAVAVSYSPSNFPANMMESQYVQMMLTEQRTHNSELRMNINKLENKIEKVLDKIELLDREGEKGTPHRDDEVLELEEKLLLLKKENRKLKQLLESKGSETTNYNQMESILEQYQVELDDLGVKECKDMRRVIKELMDKLHFTKDNVDQMKKQLQELTNISENHEKQLKTSEEQLIEKEKQIRELEASKEQLRNSLEKSEKNASSLQEQLDTTRRDYAKRTSQKSQQTCDMVKTIMNSLYGELAAKIEGLGTQSDIEAILGIVGNTIREQTLLAMEQMPNQ